MAINSYQTGLRRLLVNEQSRHLAVGQVALEDQWAGCPTGPDQSRLGEPRHARQRARASCCL